MFIRTPFILYMQPVCFRKKQEKKRNEFHRHPFSFLYFLFYFIFCPVRRTNNTLNLSPYVPFAASSGFFCLNILFRLDSELIVMDGWEGGTDSRDSSGIGDGPLGILFFTPDSSPVSRGSNDNTLINSFLLHVRLRDCLKEKTPHTKKRQKSVVN